MSSSWIVPVSLEGWWRCCKEQPNGEKCNREVNSAAWGNTCPACAHIKCGDCTAVDAPSVAAFQGVNLENYQISSYPSSRQTNYQVLSYPTYTASNVSSNYSSIRPYSFYRRPSMAGWWKCSECTREVNPVLLGWRCPDCGHHYNAECCTLY